MPQLCLHHNFHKGQHCDASPVPFLLSAITTDGSGGEASRKVDSLVFFEAGSCCFPLNYLPDKNFLMLHSPLWLQNDQACCTPCPGGVTLVTRVYHVSHSGGGFPVGCHQQCAAVLHSQGQRVCFGVRGALRTSPRPLSGVYLKE